MLKFCTACGTRNDVGAGFCEECGTPLRSAAAAPAASNPSPGPSASEGGAATAPVAVKRWMVPAAVAAVIVIVVVAAAVWWLSPPAPSGTAFASALRATSGTSPAPSMDLLCLANLPYDRAQINVQPYDASTRRWMDGLASGGLYTPGEPVQG